MFYWGGIAMRRFISIYLGSFNFVRSYVSNETSNITTSVIHPFLDTIFLDIKCSIHHFGSPCEFQINLAVCVINGCTPACPLYWRYNDTRQEMFPFIGKPLEFRGSNFVQNWFLMSNISNATGRVMLLPLLLLAWFNGLIPAWISNHVPSKLTDELTDPFPNCNSVTAEVWDG